MTIASALAYLSGLHWVAPGLDVSTLVGTTTALHTCDAIMCRLFARNNHYPARLWALLGFVFGIWAVAILIVLPRRREIEQRPIAADSAPAQHAPHA